MSSSIEVKNATLRSLFSPGNFHFKVPDYQRPYSWGIDQVSDLLDDICTAFPYGTNDGPSYFLGSVILIKQNNKLFDIVDGQQRITTLTLILSAICYFWPNSEQRNQIKQQFIETKDVITGAGDPVLRLRDSDDNFFGHFVRNAENLEKAIGIDTSDKPDSQLNLIDNIRYLLNNKLDCPDSVDLNDWLKHLLGNILDNCFVVTIATEDFQSAYRIFSTINSRGLDLKINDILKAEIIAKIPVGLQGKYTQIWDIEESDLGRDDFEKLFIIIRSFLLNQRKYGDLLTSFRKEILPRHEPTAFIDKILKQSSDIFENIRFSNFNCNNQEHQEKIRVLCKWLNEIDNSDWIPSAVYFMLENRDDSNQILRFLKELERLAAGLMILRERTNNRERIFHALVSAIKEGPEAGIAKAHGLLKPLSGRIVKKLNGNIYKEKQYRSYVLLRLDSALADGGISPSLEHKPTIEHILPQNPSPDSQWMKDWQDPKVAKEWVHRLGNLAFLSRKANAKAKNYDFQEKKEKYFMTKSGAPVYPITVRVLNQKIWTPAVVEEYQGEYISLLKSVWNL